MTKEFNPSFPPDIRELGLSTHLRSCYWNYMELPNKALPAPALEGYRAAAWIACRASVYGELPVIVYAAPESLRIDRQDKAFFTGCLPEILELDSVTDTNCVVEAAVDAAEFGPNCLENAVLLAREFYPEPGKYF